MLQVSDLFRKLTYNGFVFNMCIMLKTKQTLTLDGWMPPGYRTNDNMLVSLGSQTYASFAEKSSANIGAVFGGLNLNI